MTGSRKKIGLGLFWGGLALLMIGASALLVFAMRVFIAERSALITSQGRLEALYKMEPFPSAQNVEKEQQNLATLQTALGNLQTALARNQVEPAELKQPTVFMESFWQTQKEIVAQARAAGVVLPEEFGFGMDNYLKGTPPKPDYVPRLMQQLTITKSLCDILFQSKVTAIEAIGRERFEEEDEAASAGAGDPPSTGVGRSRRPPRGGGGSTDSRATVMMTNPQTGLMEPGALFATMKFVLLFRAKEDSALEVLNRLAAQPMFTVVKRVTWSAPRDQVTIRTKVIEKDRGTPETTAELGKESRVVSGRESTLTVRVDLEVYRFIRKAE